MKLNFCDRPAKKLIISCLAILSLAAATTPVSATIFLWNVGSPGLNDWNVSGNWLGGTGYPGPADAATFGSTGTSGDAGTANNEVSVNTTVTTLAYTNAATGAWNVTDIPAGVTLTATNVTMGGLNGTGLITDVALTDAGTFQVYSNMALGNGGASPNAISVVNFSGLSNFVYSAPGGTITMGPLNYGLVNLSLAGVSNFITAATINDNLLDTSSSSTTTLTLGGGTNIINAGTFNIAAGRNSTTVAFPPGSVGGGLRLRGVGGADTDLVNMTLGNHNTSGSGSHSLGNLSLNGYPVDLRFSRLTLGQSSSTPTGTSYGSGTLSFDTGTVYASNVVMAVTIGAGTSAGTVYAQGIGVVNVGSANSTNATLIIGPGGMSMVNQTNSAPPSVASTGTLNITGGIVVCSNSIYKSSSVGTATITMNGGGLDVVSGTIGTAATNIDSVTLNNGAVHFNVNGTAPAAAIYANSLSAGGMTIAIDTAANVTIPITVHLISYNAGTSGDQFPGFTLGSLPAGYSGTLVDNSGSIDLTIQPAGVTIQSLIWNGNVNSSWDYGTANWINGASPSVYNNPDLAYFNDTAHSPTVTLTANFTPGAFAFTNSGAANSGLDYTLNGPGSVGGNVGMIKDGQGSVTLAESGGDNFSGGISVVNGTAVLDDASNTVSGGVNVANGATLQIGNNDGNGALPTGSVTINGSLIFDQTSNAIVAVPINGSGSVTQNGSETVTLSANNTYTGNTTINNGTLALTNSGTLSNSTTVAVSSGTLDLSGETNPIVLQSLTLANAKLVLAMPNQQAALNVSGSLSFGGSANTVGVTTLPSIASYPTTLTLVQTAGGISGFNLTVASLPTGFAGTVSVSGDGTAILLTLTSGPVSIRTSVLWVGTNNVSITTNWSDRLNWQFPGAPTPSDTVIFADNGTGSSGTPFNSVGDGPGGIVSPANLNNIVDASLAVKTLTYTNVGGSSYAQNTLIANGATLTVASTNSSNLTVGSPTTDFGAGVTENVTIAGTSGTLAVNNTNGVLFVGLGDGATGTEQAILDLSGLGTFNATVGTFLVGVGSGSEAISLGRESGIVYLAQTNNITAAAAVTGTETSDTSASAVAFDIGDDDGNGGMSSALYLGQSNSIAADAIAVGRQKPTATMAFNPNFIGDATLPTAYFSGASSDLVTTWSIGDGGVNSGSGENAIGTCDFTGGFVNASVATMYVGRASGNATGTGSVAGTLTFDDGFFFINNLYAGYQPTNSLKTVTGTINVNSNSTAQLRATLTALENIYLGLTTSGGAAASGTLNINNGALAANAIVCGVNGATSDINLNGGILAVATTVGTPSAPLTSLSLNGGRLLLQPNGFTMITNVVATGVTVGAPTVIDIGAVTGVNGTVTLPLITYLNGSDPTLNNLSVNLPVGYTGHLIDDGVSTISVSLTSTVSTSPFVLTNSVANGQILLSWPASHIGWRLEVQTNSLATGLNTNSSAWFTVPNSTVVDQTNFPVNPANGAVFYRMVYP